MYDFYGNRLTQSVVKGSGPTASTPVYPATNRLQDASIDYDAAGNVTRFSMPDSSQRWLTWDALNRMTAAWTGSPYPNGHTEVYTYDAGNQRVMKQRDQDQPVFTFYGIDGKPMGDYTVNWDTTHVWFTGGGWNASVGFFGLENPNRLQSRGNHYPYGEQKGAYTPSFATYTRESFTNLDYAINRYYSAPTGRFISPDQGPFDPSSPQSWNRYSYAWSDPINLNDPDGMLPAFPGFVPGGSGGCGSAVGEWWSWGSGSIVVVGSPTLSPLRRLARAVETINDFADASPNEQGGYNLIVDASFYETFAERFAGADPGTLVIEAPAPPLVKVLLVTGAMLYALAEWWERSRDRTSCTVKCHLIDFTLGIDMAIGYIQSTQTAATHQEACAKAKKDIDDRIASQYGHQHRKRHCRDL